MSHNYWLVLSSLLAARNRYRRGCRNKRLILLCVFYLTRQCIDHSLVGYSWVATQAVFATRIYAAVHIVRVRWRMRITHYTRSTNGKQSWAWNISWINWQTLGVWDYTRIVLHIMTNAVRDWCLHMWSMMRVLATRTFPPSVSVSSFSVANEIIRFQIVCVQSSSVSARYLAINI